MKDFLRKLLAIIFLFAAPIGIALYFISMVFLYYLVDYNVKLIISRIPNPPVGAELLSYTLGPLFLFISLVMVPVGFFLNWKGDKKK